MKQHDAAHPEGTVVAELGRGATVRVDDVAADARTADAGPAFAALETRAALSVPLVKEGRLTAIVYVHDRLPRRWSDAEAEFVRDVAERAWSALGRVRAETALRRLNEGLEAQVDERFGQHAVDVDGGTVKSGGTFGAGRNRFLRGRTAELEPTAPERHGPTSDSRTR